MYVSQPGWSVAIMLWPNNQMSSVITFSIGEALTFHSVKASKI